MHDKNGPLRAATRWKNFITGHVEVTAALMSTSFNPAGIKVSGKKRTSENVKASLLRHGTVMAYGDELDGSPLL